MEAVPTKSFRTTVERQAGAAISQIFERCSDSTEVKLENFPKYVRRQHLKRFLALYEIFKLALPVKGSIIECGVFRGFGFMSWAKLSTIFEPENLMRRVYGFDSFSGFPTIDAKDANIVAMPQQGELASNSKDELEELVAEYDKDRFLGHLDKCHLIAGNACETIPQFVQDHPHLVVSLLFSTLICMSPRKRHSIISCRGCRKDPYLLSTSWIIQFGRERRKRCWTLLAFAMFGLNDCRGIRTSVTS